MTRYEQTVFIERGKQVNIGATIGSLYQKGERDVFLCVYTRTRRWILLMYKRVTRCDCTNQKCSADSHSDMTKSFHSERYCSEGRVLSKRRCRRNKKKQRKNGSFTERSKAT